MSATSWTGSTRFSKCGSRSRPFTDEYCTPELGREPGAVIHVGSVHGRALLVRLVVVQGRPNTHVVVEQKVSLATGYKWLARWPPGAWSGRPTVRARAPAAQADESPTSDHSTAQQSEPRPCPTRRQSATWAIERAVRAARLKVEELPEGFRFRDLRHYLASLLIGSGLDV